MILIHVLDSTVKKDSDINRVSTEVQRVRGDLIEKFTFMRVFDRVHVESSFLVGESKMRDHCLEIRNCSFKTEVRNSILSEGSRSLELSKGGRSNILEYFQNRGKYV